MLRLRQLALAAAKRDPVIDELRAFLAVPLGYIDLWGRRLWLGKPPAGGRRRPSGGG